MWLVEKYIKYAIIMAVLWGILYLQRNLACSSMTTDQMLPLIKKEEFFVYFPRERATRDFKHNDLVYFQQTAHGRITANEFVARVIAKPGDRVRIEAGTVIVNGEPRSEQFVSQEHKSHDSYPEIVVPRDHLYVLSDLRGDWRTDSRAFGPISKFAIIGRVKSPGS